MVTTFSLLLVNFGANGFIEAVIQREEIDHFLASNLFWINLAAGLLLTIGFAAAGSLLARFYHNPHVAHVTVGVSLTIILTSTSVLHLALLYRSMRFAVVSANNVFAGAVSVAVSILLAWAGWGYWALVAGAVAQALSKSVGAWYLCRWVPSLPRRAVGTASMVKYAMKVYGRFGVNYFGQNMDNLLVGWRFSAQALGLYKKAYDLFAVSGTLFASSLTTVAVSALSRFNRDSIEYRRNLLSAIAVIAFVGMGLGANLTLVGKDVILLLLGKRWEESGRVFTYFGPGIGVMILYGTHSWIHLSIGRPDRWFRWGVIEFLCTVCLFFVALPWGPKGIALAWTVSFFILMFPAFRYAGEPIKLGIAPIFAIIWKFFVASVVAACSTAWLIHMVQFEATPGALGALARFLSTSLLFLLLYISAVVALHRGFGDR